jgi:Uma2 family endonuclease
VKVRVADDRIYYPDIVVVCHPVHDSDTLIDDPCLVMEVTSRSTARIDRGEKLTAYCGIASLQAYLIVDQARRRVQVHRRDAGGVWQPHEATGEDTIDVPCPGTTLTLDAIYEGVDVTLREPEPAEYEA